jgi:hypothetical protein
MLSARSFQPSKFQSVDPADLSELRVGASYSAASGRSTVTVVRCGDDHWHQTDLVWWALAVAVRLGHDAGGRQATVLSDNQAAASAQLARAYAAVGGTGGPPLRSAAATAAGAAAATANLTSQVVVVPELGELDEGLGVTVGRTADQLLKTFVHAPPAPPPVAAPPQCLAASVRLGSAGLPQLFGALASLQNDKAGPARGTDPEMVEAFGLGIVTAFRPGDSVRIGNAHAGPSWTVWAVVPSPSGGLLDLRAPTRTGNAQRTVHALKCARAPTSAYLPGSDDAVLGRATQRGDLRVQGAVPGTPVRYAVAEDVDSLGRLLSGHCSYVDLAPTILQATRWAVWRPRTATDTDGPPLLCDFGHGPPTASVRTALLAMQNLAARTGANDLATLPPQLLEPHWDLARNLVWAYFLSHHALTANVVFPGGVAGGRSTRVLVLVTLPDGTMPATATQEAADAYLRRYATLSIYPMMRLWMTTVALALNPRTPVYTAVSIVSAVLSVEFGRYGESVPADLTQAVRPFQLLWQDPSRRHDFPPGMSLPNVEAAVDVVRTALVDALWRHLAADWCKTPGLMASLAPSTTVLYCDWSQRLLAFAAASHATQSVVALPIGPQDPEWARTPTVRTSVEVDGRVLLDKLKVLVVHQATRGQVLPPVPTTLVLSAAPPNRDVLLRTVQQSSRALRPPVHEVPVVLLIDGQASAGKFTTLAQSVNIADFVQPAAAPASAAAPTATTAWNSAPARPSPPGVVRLDQLASPELLAAIQSSGPSLEADEWQRLLSTARGLRELVDRQARLSSLEGPADLNTLPPDQVAGETGPALKDLAVALATSAAASPAAAPPAAAPPAAAPNNPARPIMLRGTKIGTLTSDQSIQQAQQLSGNHI